MGLILLVSKATFSQLRVFLGLVWHTVVLIRVRYFLTKCFRDFQAILADSTHMMTNQGHIPIIYTIYPLAHTEALAYGLCKP